MEAQANNFVLQLNTKSSEFLNRNLNLLTLIPMKKIIYTLLFAIASSLTISACTEEEVKPQSDLSNGGGGHTDPITR